MYVFKTKLPEETFAIGEGLGKLVVNGDVICLAGNLGAGKTVLVQGMAKALKIDSAVTSPTFNLLNVYEASIDVYHFDLYRLDSVDELENIGFYEYAFSGSGLSIIEWPDKFPDEMPDSCLWIDIETGENESDRVLSFKPRGIHYEKLCEELKLLNDSGFRYSNPSV